MFFPPLPSQYLLFLLSRRNHIPIIAAAAITIRELHKSPKTSDVDGDKCSDVPDALVEDDDRVSTPRLSLEVRNKLSLSFIFIFHSHWQQPIVTPYKKLVYLPNQPGRAGDQ